jgi:hypothetical protein
MDNNKKKIFRSFRLSKSEPIFRKVKNGKVNDICKQNAKTEYQNIINITSTTKDTGLFSKGCSQNYFLL